MICMVVLFRLLARGGVKWPVGCVIPTKVFPYQNASVMYRDNLVPCP